MNVVDYRVIGRNIRKARLSRRMSVGVLAHRAELTDGEVERIERGAKINLDVLVAVCNALGVRAGTVLYGAIRRFRLVK